LKRRKFKIFAGAGKRWPGSGRAEPETQADLEDDPGVPRETFFSRISRLEADYLPAPALAAVGTLVMFGAGSLLPVLVAAGAGGLLGVALGRMNQQKYATRVQEQLARGGLLLWVNVCTSHEEETALEVSV